MLLCIVGDDVFHCFYERMAERKIWFFFIRQIRAKEAGQEWVARPFKWAKVDWLGRQRKEQVISSKGPPHRTVLGGGRSTARDSC